MSQDCVSNTSSRNGCPDDPPPYSLTSAEFLPVYCYNFGDTREPEVELPEFESNREARDQQEELSYTTPRFHIVKYYLRGAILSFFIVWFFVIVIIACIIILF